MAPLGLGEFHVSPGLVGLLAAGEPLGALMGGALIAAGVLRMDRRLMFAGGSSLFMVMLLVVALSPSYWLALAVLIIGGFGTAGFGNMQTTLMLTEAPIEMRSRLMGIVTVVHRHRPARRVGRRHCRPRVRPARRDPGHGEPGSGGDARPGVRAAPALGSSPGSRLIDDGSGGEAKGRGPARTSLRAGR